MKHLKLIIISAAAVSLLLVAVLVVAVILRGKPLIVPDSITTEDRIARIGAVILRTKLGHLQDMGTYLQLKMQGEELLGIRGEGEDEEGVEEGEEGEDKEDAAAPSAGSGAAEEANQDGNAGAACASNEECKTPGEYLMMSSCPFSSRCIAHRCAVVCPMSEIVADGSGGWNSLDVACHADTDCDCTYPSTDRSRCSCIEGACMTVMK